MDVLMTIEILVIVTIVIEVFVLYKHAKLENRLYDVIRTTNDHLQKSDEVMEVLDVHMTKFDEHMVSLDGHLNTMNAYITTLQEHLMRYDEHMNRLDDFIWKSYFQRMGLSVEETTRAKENP